MEFPMPSWSTLIASSSAGTSALWTYFQPILYFIVPAILVIGMITLVANTLFNLVHKK